MKTKASEIILAEPIKFVARLSTMGKRKLVIYVPLEHHKEMEKRFGKRQIKVTVEEAV